MLFQTIFALFIFLIISALKGKPVKSTLTEEGDGVYKVFVEMGDMTSEARFTLDGKPTENYRMYDNRKIMISCTFEDGVWTSETESERCMKIVTVSKREGEVINVTEKYGDIEIKKVTKKYSEYQDK